MANSEKRNGICAAGTLVVDTIKMIPVFPTIGNLVTISGIQKALGGLTHNCLMDIAKLKSGIPLYAGGCIGNDDNGTMALEAFKEAGINTDALEVVEDSTSYTDVMSETGGKKTRTFFHYRGSCDHFTAEKVLAIENNAKIFHLGYLLLLTQMDSDDPEYGIVAARVLDGLKKKGYKTSVDLVSEESDRFRHIVRPCLKYVDYFIVNEVEAGAILNRKLRFEDGSIDKEGVKKAAADILALGVGEVCAIHFPEGGFVIKKNGESAWDNSFTTDPREIVGTVGAGDAFCAGMLYAIHEDYPVEKMIHFANICAFFNLSSATSCGGAPTLEQVENFVYVKKIK